jgi:hypothetical protein
MVLHRQLAADLRYYHHPLERGRGNVLVLRAARGPGGRSFWNLVGNSVGHHRTDVFYYIQTLEEIGRCFLVDQESKTKRSGMSHAACEIIGSNISFALFIGLILAPA